MTIIETLQKIEERAQEAARAKQSATGWLNAALVLSSPVIYPLLFSLWGNVSDLLVVSGFVIAMILHGVLAYLAQTVSTADNFYFDYLDLEQAHAKAEEEADHLASHLAREEKITGVIRLMLVALSKFATFGRSNAPLSSTQVKAQIEKLMIPLIASREVIPFHGARYNFAIYLHDVQNDVLKMFYRTCHPGIDARNRDIRPNHGHVGTCFSKQEDIFSPDTLKAPALMFRGEDETTPYRSIGAAPISTIASTKGTSETRGVFIITSDEAGQIQQDQHQALVIAVALILSLFFDEADQHLQTSQTYA